VYKRQALLFGSASLFQTTSAQVAAYYTSDFHQHTRYSDGLNSLGYVVQKDNQFGLDWWAISDHGGREQYDGAISGDDLPGKPIVWWSSKTPNPILGTYNSIDGVHQCMWRWQILKQYQFPELVKLRATYPTKLILQGFELNLPGHDHASVSIINNQFDATPNVNPLAEFEFKFDKSDTDLTGGVAQGWVKSTTANVHAKSVESLTWLKNNYPTTSYMILNHPERTATKYSIADLRDMYNAAPDIFCGFEGIAGSQKWTERCEYTASSKGGGTFGGAGYYLAKVGGIWDAMLTEGRKWFIFTNSDYHEDVYNFFPGEYTKNHTYITDKSSAQAIVNGLRSGNNWIAQGDLIDSLIFNASSVATPSNIAVMGQTLALDGTSVKLYIKVRDPLGTNNNVYGGSNTPTLNHIDLIAGDVNGLIAPSDPKYSMETVSSTQVIARFDATGGVTDSKAIVSTAWTDLGGGWKEMSFTINGLSKNTYYRIRGSNIGLGVASQTDADGNPLLDGVNSAVAAFSELWLYSNPIFVSSTPTTGLTSQWTFENSSARGTDSSGNNVALTIGSSSNMAFSSDVAGSFQNYTLPAAGATFTPSVFTDTNYRSDYTSPAIAGAVTLSAWFKATNAGTAVHTASTIGYILSTPGFNLFTIKNTGDLINGNEKIRFQSRRSTTAGSFDSPTISMGTWHHIVVTYDPSSTSNVPIMYLDNNLVTVDVSAVPVGTQNANAGIGYVGNTLAGNRGFNGSLDNIRIYNGAIDAGSVNTIYNTEKRTGIDSSTPEEMSNMLKCYANNGSIIADLTALEGNTTVSIFNACGSTITSFQPTKYKTITTVPVPGIYLVRILNCGRIFSQKVIVP